jgi:hypothetical protein
MLAGLLLQQSCSGQVGCDGVGCADRGVVRLQALLVQEVLGTVKVAAALQDTNTQAWQHTWVTEGWSERAVGWQQQQQCCRDGSLLFPGLVVDGWCCLQMSLLH